MAPVDHAYRIVVEERIRELWRYRAWYRRNVGWANAPEWAVMARDDYQELRSLVRLARQARRIEATADWDAISFAKWEAERHVATRRIEADRADSWTQA